MRVRHLGNYIRPILSPRSISQNIAKVFRLEIYGVYGGKNLLSRTAEMHSGGVMAEITTCYLDLYQTQIPSKIFVLYFMLEFVHFTHMRL